MEGTVGGDPGCVHRAERGETVQPEASVHFTDWETLARTLTPRRLDLLRHLHRHPQVSINALAKALNRDYRNVHADVAALVASGLIDRDDTGGLNVAYDSIRTRIAL